MTMRHVLARLLASLSHPGIAQLLAETLADVAPLQSN